MTEAREEFQVVDADGCALNDPQPSLSRARAFLRRYQRQNAALGPFGIEWRSITTSEWEPIDTEPAEGPGETR